MSDDEPMEPEEEGELGAGVGLMDGHHPDMFSPDSSGQAHPYLFDLEVQRDLSRLRLELRDLPKLRGAVRLELNPGLSDLYEVRRPLRRASPRRRP